MKQFWTYCPPFSELIKLLSSEKIKLLCVFVRLVNTKSIAFRIQEISLPSHTLNSKLWKSHFASCFFYLFCSLIKIIYLYSTHKGISSLFWSWSWARPLQHPSINSRFFTIFGSSHHSKIF